MCVGVFSYPFRLDRANNRIAVVESGTDDDKSQQIGAFVKTTKGERPIYNSYGIDDPTFTGTFDTGEFVEGFTDYYDADDIGITDIFTTESEGVVTDIIVDYE